ncbi:MAG: nicotinate (nicotinamide) nucleotide adenylyltransferase [Bacteroidota bacterium]|jgi:nicotinate-nucleotide adenylyltransferase
MKAKVGLFFGTFNPIHLGHLVLAEYMLNYTDLDELLFVVTPHNPFKQKSTLLPDRTRLHLVNLAIDGEVKMRASDIEFDLPQPNFTAQTLVYLREKYPTTTFSIIMGEDNLRTFHKWRNYESILANHPILVYPRIGELPEDQNDILEKYPQATLVDAPRMEISASLIRQSFKDGKPLKNLLPKAVFDYIEGSNLFQ